MGISGNLKTMVLAELLQWLSMGQKTGTLVIENKRVKKRIFFDGGVIISSASTDPKEYLGRFLVNHGYIAEELVEEAVARQKDEKKLLGKILVNLGAIAEEDLHQMLQLKAEESIYDVFTWEEGDFEFLDNELPQETMIRMSLDVQWIVLEGSRRLDEWSRIRELIPSPLCVPVTVADVETLEIDEVDRRILDWIDDDRTIEEISQEAQTTLFQVSNTLAAQVQTGTVKVVRPRTIEIEVPVAAPAPEPVAPPPVAAEVPPPQPPPTGAYPPMQMPAYAQPPAVAMPPPQPPPSPPTGSVAVGGGRTLHFAGGGPAPGGPDPGAGAPSAAPPPAPAPASEAENLIQAAESALRLDDLEAALSSFRQAREAPGANSAVETAAEKGEKEVEKALERDGLGLLTVPKLKCGMDELTKIKISPQEGFLLTRVDGSYDVKSILKISPMPKLDALVLFWRLKKSGHVAV